MNGLSNQGAIFMGTMLANNETLIELNLANNRIEKDGADIFASKLENNRTLKKLWVGTTLLYSRDFHKKKRSLEIIISAHLVRLFF